MAGTDPYGLFYSGSGITVIAPDQIRPPVGAHELVQPPRYGLKLAAIWPGSPGYDEILAQAEALSAFATTNAERGVDNGLGFWDSLLLSDSPLHLTLQTIGLVPFVGEVADGLDALLYLAEGDPANASISALAMVPVIGAKATAARRAVKVADVVGEAGGQQRLGPEQVGPRPRDREGARPHPRQLPDDRQARRPHGDEHQEHRPQRQDLPEHEQTRQ